MRCPCPTDGTWHVTWTEKSISSIIQPRKRPGWIRGTGECRRPAGRRRCRCLPCCGMRPLGTGAWGRRGPIGDSCPGDELRVRDLCRRTAYGVCYLYLTPWTSPGGSVRYLAQASWRAGGRISRHSTSCCSSIDGKYSLQTPKSVFLCAQTALVDRMATGDCIMLRWPSAKFQKMSMCSRAFRSRLSPSHQAPAVSGLAWQL